MNEAALAHRAALPIPALLLVAWRSRRAALRIVAAALDASGHEFLRRKTERPAKSDAEREARQQQKIERAVRQATLAAFAAAIPKAKLGVSDWIDLLASIAIEEKGWQLEDVLPRHGFSGKRDAIKGDRPEARLVRNSARVSSRREAQSSYIRVPVKGRRA